MSQEQQELQQKLAITPKPAALLIQADYHNHRDLKDTTPNHVVVQFMELGIPKTSASSYRRALRRMVWLSTQEDPEHNAKIYQDWTNKALMARCIWRDDFDDLTGIQIVDLIAVNVSALREHTSGIKGGWCSS